MENGLLHGLLVVKKYVLNVKKDFIWIVIINVNNFHKIVLMLIKKEFVKNVKTDIL